MHCSERWEELYGYTAVNGRRSSMVCSAVSGGRSSVVCTAVSGGRSSVVCSEQ